MSLRLRRMPLCQNPPWVTEPVIVAIPEGTARSTIMSPRSLPADVRTKFPTVIRDVATTGNSGSGVFDAEQKCLLGIMSGKIFIRQNNTIVAKQKDIAKYFVPAATIAAFIPNGYRYYRKVGSNCEICLPKAVPCPVASDIVPSCQRGRAGRRANA